MPNFKYINPATYKITRTLSQYTHLIVNIFFNLTSLHYWAKMGSFLQHAHFCLGTPYEVLVGRQVGSWGLVVRLHSCSALLCSQPLKATGSGRNLHFPSLQMHTYLKIALHWLMKKAHFMAFSGYEARNCQSCNALLRCILNTAQRQIWYAPSRKSRRPTESNFATLLWYLLSVSACMEPLSVEQFCDS